MDVEALLASDSDSDSDSDVEEERVESPREADARSQQRVGDADAGERATLPAQGCGAALPIGAHFKLCRCAHAEKSASPRPRESTAGEEV